MCVHKASVLAAIAGIMHLMQEHSFTSFWHTVAFPRLLTATHVPARTHLISIAPCPPPPMTCANPLSCPGLAPRPGAPPSAPPPKAPAPPNPHPVPFPSAPALFCVFCSRAEACRAPPGGCCELYAGIVVARIGCVVGGSCVGFRAVSATRALGRVWSLWGHCAASDKLVHGFGRPMRLNMACTAVAMEGGGRRCLRLTH